MIGISRCQVALGVDGSETTMAERSYTVRGARNGSQVFVTWADGKVSGDPPTVDLILVEAELAALHPEDAKSWNQVGGFDGLHADPLSDPDSAWQLIASVFDTVSATEGAVPAGAESRASRRRE